LLISHVPADLVWRLILGADAIPALAIFWLRREIAESPRFALAQGVHCFLPLHPSTLLDARTACNKSSI